MTDPSQGRTEPGLEFREVTVRYEPAAPSVLAGVSFSVAVGERVGLIGLNGSGKTTALMAVVGLVPHEGRILVTGTPLSRRSAPEIRNRVGFLFNVPENQLLFPKVIEDVAFGLVRRGLPSREASERAMRILESLGISELAESAVHHLSHGQKQRVALAGAMVTDPAVLLLDEPSAGLDPPGRRRLARLLRDLPAAMLVATHDLDFASQTCSRFLVLERGRLVRDIRDAADLHRCWEHELPYRQ
ncbi:MAG: energy-coupling factor ABC transporter ATP-binding protein [Candidatus Eisenbacteria bacterium]